MDKKKFYIAIALLIIGYIVSAVVDTIDNTYFTSTNDPFYLFQNSLWFDILGTLAFTLLVIGSILLSLSFRYPSKSIKIGLTLTISTLLVGIIDIIPPNTIGGHPNIPILFFLFPFIILFFLFTLIALFIYKRRNKINQ